MNEQFIHVNEYGDKLHYSDREMKIQHREDGPAIERANGYKAWYSNGKLHREDGPAIEYANGDTSWYINGKLHREDGPAAEYAIYGTKQWWVNGKILKRRGPEKGVNALMNPVTELTLDEIAEKFGVSVEQLKIKK